MKTGNEGSKKKIIKVVVAVVIVVGVMLTIHFFGGSILENIKAMHGL